ncbi:hypothetical protein HOO54_05485 [Bacillus sp. WMMC1349]|nr:hypothetical protein [Bacillus sp. WMMC1349]NPC91702.1 hypothetical protein [Bacillus sp. WMMC1349]
MTLVKFKCEQLIPEHHTTHVVEEMVKAVHDEQLFSHYTGVGEVRFIRK